MRAAVEHQSGRGLVAVLGGPVQRRPSGGGPGLDGRAAVEQQSDRGLVTVRGRPVQRCRSVVGRSLDGCAAVEQQSGRGLMAARGGPVQRSPPASVLGIDIGTIKDEMCYRNSLAPLACHAQCSSALVICSIYVRPMGRYARDSELSM